MAASHPRILRPSFVRADARGALVEVMNDGEWRSVLHGSMRAGAVMGQHYHKETLVLFFLETGATRVDVLHAVTGARDAFALRAGEGTVFGLLEAHAITFEADSAWLMLKSRRYDPASPDTYALAATPR